MFETPGSRVVADLLVKEGLAVAKAEGVNIPSEEADHILTKVTAKTDDAKYTHHHPGDCLAPGEQDLDVRGRAQEKAVRGGLHQWKGCSSCIKVSFTFKDWVLG